MVENCFISNECIGKGPDCPVSPLYIQRCNSWSFRSPEFGPLFRGCFKYIFKPFLPLSLHKTGTNWPLKGYPYFSHSKSYTFSLETPLMFRNCQVQYFSWVKNRQNCKQWTPRNRRKKTPLFQGFRVQAQNRDPFFDFEYKAHENSHFFFKIANMLKKRPLFTRNYVNVSCVHEVNTEWQHRDLLLKSLWWICHFPLLYPILPNCFY